MARSMFDALTDEEKRGTLANPGSASPLGPTLSMKTGAFLHPLLQAAKDKFPKDNPRGRWLGEMLLGDSPQRTGRVAEGIPKQYFHYNRGSGSNVSPEIVDLAGALPIGSAFKLAKLAAPLAAPVAMATSAAALNRLKAPGYAATSTDDIASALLGQNLGNLDDAMVGGDAGAAALARIGNTAPQQAMELAEQMESAGRSRDEIWAATADMGYPVFRGKDGQLRFEIDDSAVGFKEAPVGKSRSDLAGDYFESKGVPRTKRATGQYPELDREALAWADANRQSNPTVPVYESIIHPEMQQAYPDSGVRIGRVDPGTRDLSGYFDPATKEIRYGGGTIRDTDNAGTALHELQHATQGAEGFARGGNPKFSSGMDEAAQFEAARRAYNSANFSADGMTDDVLLHELTGRAMPSQPPKAWDELSRKEQVKWLEAGRYDNYKRLAGEAEARQVQARMDMSPAERAYKPFYADYDVPEADQIVRYLDGPSAMVAYQGSPHKFDALDPTKIGTGEGAQVFGHGMYVAENPDVAGGYVKAGQPSAATDVKTALWHIKNNVPIFDDLGTEGSREAYRMLTSSPEFEDMARRAWDDIPTMNEVHKMIVPSIEKKGYLYEIDVPDEDIAKMLDWDAPLSEQPEAVKRVAKEFGIKTTPSGTREARGSDIYRAISHVKQKPPYDNTTMNPGSREGSQYLSELGIPGIKYYDKGSRAAEEGTRNMVLFDDLARRAKVLKRNDETIAEPSVDEFIGGLLDDELPLDEASRMHEATFGEDLYHGTVADIDEFEVSDLGVHLGTQDAANVRLSDKEATRSGVSRYKTRNQDFGESANILPVRTSAQNPLRMDDAGEWRDPSSVITELRTSELMSKNPKLHERLLDMQDEADKLHESYAFGDLGSEGWYESPEAAEMLDEIRKMIEAEGYDSIKYTNFIESRGKNADSTIVLNPKNIRSKFAKFDPAKKDSANILAGAAGAGVLSGLYEPDALQDDEKMRRALLRN